MNSKKCFKCGQVKPLDQFHKHSKMADGHLNKCGACTVNDVRAWREKKGKKKDRADRYARELENGARTRVRSQKEISETKDTPEIQKAKKKAYYEKNKPAFIARARKWCKDNSHKIYASRKRRYYNDPAYRLRIVLSARVRAALGRINKSAPTVELLGCSAEFARGYIEAKFVDGMTWDNWGEWHIDHIIPFASFDLTKHDQVLAACHYTNLQPLWAKDNLEKGAKLVY